MARNTAEYSSSRTEDYHDENPEPRTPEKAFLDFTNQLESKYPGLGHQLNEPHHPGADHTPEWLDPEHRDQALAHIKMSFEDATRDLDDHTREQTAHKLANRLIEPITYPATLMAQTYTSPPSEHASERVRRYAGRLQAAAKELNELNLDASNRFTKDLLDDNPFHRRDLALDVAYMQYQVKDHHATYLASALMNARPQGMDYDHNELHAKALGEALAYPIDERIQKANTDFSSPLDDYRKHLGNGDLYDSPEASDVIDITHRMETIHDKRVERWEQRLEKIHEDLVHDLTHTEHGYTELRQALTDIDHLNQQLDYRSPAQEAAGLREAFELSVQHTGAQHREEMAKHFAQALAWNYWQDTQDHLAAHPDLIQTLGHQVESQAGDLAGRMATGQYDADNIRFTLESVNSARRTLAETLVPQTE